MKLKKLRWMKKVKRDMGKERERERNERKERV